MTGPLVIALLAAVAFAYVASGAVVLWAAMEFAALEDDR